MGINSIILILDVQNKVQFECLLGIVLYGIHASEYDEPKIDKNLIYISTSLQFSNISQS